MGLGRFELPTSPLSGVRSNQLSYRPEKVVRIERASDSLKTEQRRYVIAFDRPRVRTRDARGVRAHGLLRKEVIQPQVLLQLPCYDFTPITKFTIET